MTVSDASEMFQVMDEAIERDRYVRRSTSPASPQQEDTVEAEPGLTFAMRCGAPNVATQRPCSIKWAVANALHFFAGTEEASSLARYNRYAEKFAPNGKWIGAYGAIAVPQLLSCVAELERHSESRRAFVSMGAMHPMDINRPACWNHLHFLKWRGKLDMLVEQRSLMLHGVFAYDCVVLTNVLSAMACTLKLDAGKLRWRVGSLHKLASHPRVTCWTPPCTLYLPHSVASVPCIAQQWLDEPERAPSPWSQRLTGD